MLSCNENHTSANIEQNHASIIQRGTHSLAHTHTWRNYSQSHLLLYVINLYAVFTLSPALLMNNYKITEHAFFSFKWELGRSKYLYTLQSLNTIAKYCPLHSLFMYIRGLVLSCWAVYHFIEDCIWHTINTCSLKPNHIYSFFSLRTIPTNVLLERGKTLLHHIFN